MTGVRARTAAMGGAKMMGVGLTIEVLVRHVKDFVLHLTG